MRHTLLIFVLSIFTLPASGQVFFTGGGSAILTPNDLGDAYGVGISLSGGFSLRTPGVVQPRLLAFWSRHGLDEEGEGLEGGALTMAGMAGDILFAPPTSELQPYIGPTLGIVNVSAGDLEVIDVLRIEFEDTAGFLIGGAIGLRYNMPSASIFVEGRVLRGLLQRKDVTWLPFTLGVVVGR